MVRSLAFSIGLVFFACTNQKASEPAAAAAEPTSASAPQEEPTPAEGSAENREEARIVSDPHEGKFTIQEAAAGLEGKGKLTAVIETTLGTLNCELFEKEAPGTVANFVGLARGLRAFKDPESGEWVKRPYFDGIVFHRVIPKFMIQGGDPLGQGTGGPGYSIQDEFHPKLKHDKGGLLSMANRGPNTGGSQFFVTEVATPHLDGRHAVFGACAEVDLVEKIARVKAERTRPIEPVKMTKVEIVRK